MSEAFRQDIFAQWAHAGFTCEAALSSNDRTTVYRLRNGSQYYAGKISRDARPALIQNEAWWCLALPRLAAANAPVRAPQLHSTGPGWLITEYIDAPLLVADGWNQGEPLWKSVADPLVEALLWLDGLMRPTSVASSQDTTDSAPYFHLLRRVDAWLQEPLEKGSIKAKTVTAAKQLIEAGAAHVTPAFQHGDFVPWHTFRLDSGQLCLFDGEHASLVKPRFYDLAYLYTRLYTRCAAPNTARYILQNFVDRLDDPATFWPAFQPVITLRALGMTADALHDLERYDYTTAARDILDRCLSGTPEALTRP